MSTGYSWEGIRQVRATLLGARHVPERLCGGYVYLGRYISVRPLPYLYLMYHNVLSPESVTAYLVLHQVSMMGDAQQTFFS